MKKTGFNALLSVSEMYEADHLTISDGTSGLELMENAGNAITREILKRYAPAHALILCGPGNNGGDGFVVARQLKEHGVQVKVLFFGDVDRLKGDAAANARRWSGKISPLWLDELCETNVIVDAIFGAGLDREITGPCYNVLKQLQSNPAPVVGVDVPSGLHGDRGEVLGIALQADVTVTFARPKTGHYLYPGKALCGDLVIADIGIPERVIEQIAPKTTINAPCMLYPFPPPEGHKYSRGHALVIGGSEMTGATRLAAQNARRVGAGLLTIAANNSSYEIYRNAEPGNIVSREPLEQLLCDPRKNAVLCGPGLGLQDMNAQQVKMLMESEKALVLDADALTLLAQHDLPKRTFETLITPHEGEFARLFPHLKGSKLERARLAAQESGYTVLLKGPDSVIAHPDGQSVINTTGTPWLATAGSGDCLAGICLGLMAQGLNAYDAASLGAWLHGKCAETFGPGLICEDIADTLPLVLKSLATKDIRC